MAYRLRITARGYVSGPQNTNGRRARADRPSGEASRDPRPAGARPPDDRTRARPPSARLAHSDSSCETGAGAGAAGAGLLPRGDACFLAVERFAAPLAARFGAARLAPAR